MTPYEYSLLGDLISKWRIRQQFEIKQSADAHSLSDDFRYRGRSDATHDCADELETLRKEIANDESDAQFKEAVTWHINVIDHTADPTNKFCWECQRLRELEEGRRKVAE